MKRSDTKHPKIKPKQQGHEQKTHKNLSVDTESKYIPSKHGLLCLFVKNGYAVKTLFSTLQMRVITSISEEMPPSMLSSNIQIPA